MAKTVRLAGNQKLILYEWLKANATQDYLTRSRISVPELAERASKELKFQVSHVSVGPILEHLGLVTSQAQAKRGAKDRLTLIEERLTRIETELGIKLPDAPTTSPPTG